MMSLPQRAKTLLILLVLSTLAAALRLTFLNHPALWGDEVATYIRVSGTFQDLTDALRETGFTPLHYEGAYALIRMLGPSPWVLRLIPAICGTLMVPAMYFLGLQLVSQRA